MPTKLTAIPAHLSADGGEAYLCGTIGGRAVHVVRRRYRYDPRPMYARLDNKPDDELYYTVVVDTKSGRSASLDSRRDSSLGRVTQWALGAMRSQREDGAEVTLESPSLATARAEGGAEGARRVIETAVAVYGHSVEAAEALGTSLDALRASARRVGVEWPERAAGRPKARSEAGE